MEFIHFDTATQSVEWGVSQGTVNEEGEFVAGQNAITTYSINLQTGEMKHDGQSVQMRLNDSENASRVFEALALLMQSYTDRWDGSGDLDRPASREDSPAMRLYRIAARGPMGHRSSSARGGDRLPAIRVRKVASIPQNSLLLGTACKDSQIYPSLEVIPLPTLQ